MLMNRRHRHITASRPARRRAIRALPAQPPICSQLRGLFQDPPIRAVPLLAPIRLLVLLPTQILALLPTHLLVSIPSHLCRQCAERSKFVALPVLGVEVGWGERSEPHQKRTATELVGLAALSATLQLTENSEVGWGE